MEKIGFIGFGKIAKAIASGIQKKHEIYYYDVDPNTVNSYEHKEKIQGCNSISELEKKCNIVILSVKPKDMKKVVSECSGEKIYITVAAGIALKKYFEWNPSLQKIVRVMPNIGAFVNSSVTAIYGTDKQLVDLTNEIFSTIGKTIILQDENLMHAITALSGSGPAYVFLFLEAMIEAGIREGLSYETSYLASIHTILGAIKILINENYPHPAEYKRQVTSPGGTTIEGLTALEKHNFRYAIIDAIHNAYEKSKKLGE